MRHANGARTGADQFGFVGLFERFDESILMLKYLAGFHTLLYNKTKAVVSRPHVEGAGAHTCTQGASPRAA